MDEDISFMPHIENIPKKYKQTYNRLTLCPEIRSDLAVQLFKVFIWSKLEYGIILWRHTLYTLQHLKLLETSHKGVLILILMLMLT